MAALGPIPVCSTFGYNETFVSVGLSPYIYLTTTLYGGLYHKPCATVTDPNFHWQPLPLSPLILAMTAAELVFCVMFVLIVNILYG